MRTPIARNRLPFAALALASALLAGADAPAPDQAKPKSPAAAAAMTKADKAVAEAEAAYKAAAVKARRQEVGDLKAAQEAALKNGAAGLEEANRIGAEVKRAQGEIEALKASPAAQGPNGADAAKEALVSRLEGTRWKFGEWQVTFGRGTYAFSNWDKQGTWTVVSPQTIECHEPWGKTKRWIFDPDLTVTTEFEGQHVIGSAVRIAK